MTSVAQKEYLWVQYALLLDIKEDASVMDTAHSRKEAKSSTWNGGNGTCPWYKYEVKGQNLTNREGPFYFKEKPE